MTREPRCSAIVHVKGRGAFRCPHAGKLRHDHAWYCLPHYRAAAAQAAPPAR